MNSPKDKSSGSKPAAKKSMEDALADFQKLDGVDRAKAEVLYDSGFTSLEDLGGALEEELTSLEGFDGESASSIVLQAKDMVSGDAKKDGKAAEDSKAVEDEGVKDGKGKKHDKEDEGSGSTPAAKKDKAAVQGNKSAGGDEALENWLSGEKNDKDALENWLRADSDKPSKSPSAPVEKAPGKENARAASTDMGDEHQGEDSLKKWLMGDEDTSLEDWLTEDPEEIKAYEASFSTGDMGEIKAMVESMVNGIKSGKTDMSKVLSENIAIKQALANEIKKREEAERELQNVKKSSVAVVKYIKTQQAKLKGKDVAKLQDMLDRQNMVKEKLEIRLHETEMELRTIREELGKKLDDLRPDEKKIKEKELELLDLKKELAVKEKTLLQKEEALASGEGILLREAGDGSEGGDPAAIAEREGAWSEEKARLLEEKADIEKKLEAALLDKKQLEDRIEHMGMDEGALSKDLLLKEKEISNREKECFLKLEEYDDLKRTVALREEEIRKLKEAVVYKEEELLRREADIMHREKIMVAEQRKIAEAKKGIGSMEQQEAQKRLEELKGIIADKERELITKEKYIRTKEEELRVREKGVIEGEIEAREEDRKLEWNIEKIKVGITRLDDLLMGGVPFGSNIVIYGPPFVGKETLMNIYIAEGLKKGVPAVWIITDKTAHEIKEEMTFVVSGYEEYEKMGLVRYVDLYSATIGEAQDAEYTTYVEDIHDTKATIKIIDEVCKEVIATQKARLMENASKELSEEMAKGVSQKVYYRLAFRSISTMVAYLGATDTFKFLQPFTGRRKRENAVSMYAIEKGMHKDEEIQSISHTMDGTIDFKSEQMKTYLAVQGICDTQSKSYVEYTHSKQSINIGSFSLDHIR